MNQKDKSGDVFPFQVLTALGNEVHMGLSKREWYAGMALQGILASHDGNPNTKVVAETCLDYADALIAESKREDK